MMGRNIHHKETNFPSFVRRPRSRTKVQFCYFLECETDKLLHGVQWFQDYAHKYIHLICLLNSCWERTLVEKLNKKPI